jgi:precorrin-3B synthase
MRPVVQGWCPGALRPMASGDGLVVRVRPPGGTLSSVQATGLADLAARHGNGLLDLSVRANLQLRGVTEASHPALLLGLTALGLLDSNAKAEKGRNIIITPFWTDGDTVQPIAQALQRAVTAADWPDLPSKFGYAIDNAHAPVLRATSADIRIEARADGFLIWPDGAATGAQFAAADAVIAAIADLIAWFLQSGGVNNGRGRMAALMARGATLPQAFSATPVSSACPFTPAPGMLSQGALLGLEFGQMQAQTLADLAAFGPLRVTPWRMLMLEGAGHMPDLPGLITRPDDPMLRVIACTGAPGCLQAHQPTRDLARTLAPAWRSGTLHVSGCAKGCAHPTAANVTLVGTPDGFDLIRNGTAADMPAECALSPFLTELPQ